VRQVNAVNIENLQELRERSGLIGVFRRKDDASLARFSSRVRLHDVGSAGLEFRLENKSQSIKLSSLNSEKSRVIDISREQV
jgi:hypothetical protein